MLLFVEVGWRVAGASVYMSCLASTCQAEASQWDRVSDSGTEQPYVLKASKCENQFRYRRIGRKKGKKRL